MQLLSVFKEHNQFLSNKLLVRKPLSHSTKCYIMGRQAMVFLPDEVLTMVSAIARYGQHFHVTSLCELEGREGKGKEKEGKGWGGGFGGRDPWHVLSPHQTPGHHCC